MGMEKVLVALRSARGNVDGGENVMWSKGNGYCISSSFFVGCS